MDIYLIRHTEVAVGRKIAYGQSDVDLTDTYAEQLNRLKNHLPDGERLAHPSTIFSSPLRRCRRLAEDLASALSSGSQIETAPGQTAIIGAERPGVQFDDRLKELSFGDWEMIPWADISPELLATWRADYVKIRMPNGENFQDLYQRVTTFWQEQIRPLEETNSAQCVFIVSHGGAIRALLCLFMELPLSNAYRINLDYGAVSKLTLTKSSYTIQYINR
ncbi:alpha-ribazole phosphatase family protein [Spirosoma validum]|uniref:Alpha-ribazole phosphatase family protein n=1 Tax=Spirosoma validum TaxID=2771355 RepID=A0A927B315_9BACT|nr:alpha-ribazole phosphatase family protein [Spirosoma validum]MBD2754485.1 alpha-ribazole phosphatase family protein [Spirosoma validum]